MDIIAAIIIGAGQAGLATSRALSRRGIEHIVLERGRVGERWRSGRWNSLRLLSIAEQSYLPGMPHEGIDPEHFLPARDFADYLGRYAEKFAAPVVGMSAVQSVTAAPCGYRVRTAGQCWHSRSVIIATGDCDVAHRPAMASNLPPGIVQVLPTAYRSPAGLPDGGVLVVGASSTGLQIAEELQDSGRHVTLAVGAHTRMLRRYRGRDIYTWLGLAGILDERAEDCINLQANRRQPSTQLIGCADHRELSLATAQSKGIRLMGRLLSIDGHKLRFADDLLHTTAKSHARMIKTLGRVDDFIERHRVAAVDSGIERIVAFSARSNAEKLDLADMGISSVVWAAGYKRDYAWLDVPVIDAGGELVQHRGITASPGLYTVGLAFQSRRRSAFIDGCGIDAEFIADRVSAHLAHRRGLAAEIFGPASPRNVECLGR